MLFELPTPKCTKKLTVDDTTTHRNKSATKHNARSRQQKHGKTMANPNRCGRNHFIGKRKPKSREETMEEGYEKENKEAKVRILGSRGQVVKVYLLLNRSYFHNNMLFPIRQQSFVLHLILLVQNIPSLVCFLFFSKINFPPK